MELDKISNNLVKSVSTGEMVPIESFWKDSQVVLIFLRRFGWQICRLGAQNISQLKPRLDANNVKLVGIGLEELGVEEFVQGGWFKGDLYIDMKKECYKKLGFRRFNVFSLIPGLFGKAFKDAYAKSKELKIPGNMSGDGFQNGGAFVVDQGGKALLTFKQEQPGQHVDPNEVLKKLGIEGEVQEEAKDTPVCDDGACALPKKS